MLPEILENMYVLIVVVVAYVWYTQVLVTLYYMLVTLYYINIIYYYVMWEISMHIIAISK